MNPSSTTNPGYCPPISMRLSADSPLVDRVGLYKPKHSARLGRTECLLWRPLEPNVFGGAGKVLAKRREVHYRTTHEDIGHLQGALTRRHCGQDIVVLAQLDRSYARLPVEGLKGPRAALVAHLCGDEVENVAGASDIGQGGFEPRALYRGSVPVRRNDVVDDVALADQLSGLR